MRVTGTMDEVLQAILSRYGSLVTARGLVDAVTLPVRPIAGGLINQTFALGDDFVLQRVNPAIFRAEVNVDIAALVLTLRQEGVPVPELVRTRDGALWAEEPGSGAAWRILTRLPGLTHHRLQSPDEAAAGGAMLARFHAALTSRAGYSFAFSRPGAHDTDRHLAGLCAALEAHHEHRLYGAVAPIAATLTAQWRAWGRPPELPQRIIHGDPKVSNLLWYRHTVTGVVDLDTMAWSGIDIELGDALRSWCNLGLEDDPEPEPSLEFAEATIRAYIDGSRRFLTEAERAAIAPALERIALELSARFATDALNETYFGWDPARFPTRGEHNLVRARNQLGLALAAARHRPAIEAMIRA